MSADACPFARAEFDWPTPLYRISEAARLRFAHRGLPLDAVRLLHALVFLAERDVESWRVPATRQVADCRVATSDLRRLMGLYSERSNRRVETALQTLTGIGVVQRADFHSRGHELAWLFAADFWQALQQRDVYGTFDIRDLGVLRTTRLLALRDEIRLVIASRHPRFELDAREEPGRPLSRPRTPGQACWSRQRPETLAALGRLAQHYRIAMIAFVEGVTAAEEITIRLAAPHTEWHARAFAAPPRRCGRPLAVHLVTPNAVRRLDPGKASLDTAARELLAALQKTAGRKPAGRPRGKTGSASRRRTPARVNQLRRE